MQALKVRSSALNCILPWNLNRRKVICEYFLISITKMKSWGIMLPDCYRFVSFSAVARALIWGGGGYSYIRVLPDEFLLKSVVFKFISKEISRAYRT